MLWNVDVGSGGLGVHVRVPGLVRPPSLVRSAVEMVLLLQVEMHDMPRGGSLSEWSSTGELVFDADCSAVVRREVLRSMMGFEILVKDAFDEWCIFRGDGRGVRPCSGGSSTSAGTSSSAAMFGGSVLGVFCVVLRPAAPLRPTWS
jgi:hypothetical protein